MTIKLPVRIVERYDTRTSGILHRYVVDADDTAFTLEGFVIALNATASAPDLSALREAVEAWRFICNRYDRDLEGYGEVQRAEHDVLIAADILFPEKGGTP